MERMRIVGVDGSEAAGEALRWAVGFGRSFAAEIVAVHAVGLLEDVHGREDDAAAAGRVHLVRADDRADRTSYHGGS